METEKPLEKVTAEEFIKRLNIAGKRGHAFVNNLHVHQQPVWLTDENIEFKGTIQIIDCEFVTSLIFSSLSKAEVITIQRCSANYFHFIKTDLKFTNRSLYSGTLIITESIARMETLIDNCSIEKGIDVTDSTFDKLNITSSSFQHDSGEIRIYNSKILHDVVISSCSIGFAINFTTSIINDSTLIEKSSCKKLVFDRSQHMRTVEVSNLDIKENISFLGTTIEDEVVLRQIKTSNSSKNALSSLNFSDFNKFKKNCRVYINPDTDNPFQVILIENTSFGGGFDCIGLGGKGNSKIDGVYINCSRNLSGNIRFEAIEISNMALRGMNIDASFIFSHILIQSVILSDFNNLGVLKLLNIDSIQNENAHFIITESDLGKTQFSNVNFDNFNISINTSDVTNILTSSIQWFHYNQLNQPFKTLENYIQKRETFRQLKFAMEKQGDRIQALVFKQYELIAYRQELHSSTGRYDEKFIMLLNRSNSYGQNWWKPVLWAIGFTALFYYLITISQSPEISGIDFTRGGVSHLLDVLWKNFSVFFQILNPVHVIDKINEGAKDISKMTYFLDYLYRIILSYLIFQTISAFRKYVK